MLSLLNPQSPGSQNFSQPGCLAVVRAIPYLKKKKKEKIEMLHLSGVNPQCSAIVNQSWCESS